MMKEHRSTKARALGGSAALAALMVAGLALSSPGFAREEAVAPRVLVASAAAANPIIDDRDMATLRARCGHSGDNGVIINGSEDGGMIVCGNGRRIKDPEVRAIVRRTTKRAEQHVAAVTADVERIKADIEHMKLDARELAEIDREVAHAAASARHLDVEEPMKHARAALERAREQLERVNIQGIRTEALASAMASLRHHRQLRINMPHVRMQPISPEVKAEIEAALAEARAEMEEVELDGVTDELDAELERGLEGLDRPN